MICIHFIYTDVNSLAKVNESAVLDVFFDNADLG